MTKEERLRTLFRPRNLNAPAQKVVIICAECGAERERYVSQTQRKGVKIKKTYCSKTCQRLGWTKYLSDEERREAARAKQREKYRTDKAWAEERKEKARIRMARNAQNPAYIKRKKELAHIRYLKRKAALEANPRAYKAYRKHANKIAAKSREKMKKIRGPRPITDAVRARKLAWWHANKHRFKSAKKSRKKELSTAS